MWKSALVINNKVSSRWIKEMRPENFPFTRAKTTTLVIHADSRKADDTKLTGKYNIIFDIESKMYTYDFEYRNEQKPEQTASLVAVSQKKCADAFPTIFSFGTGYRIPPSTLSVGSKISIFDTAPSTSGTIVIDISSGPQNKKKTLKFH